MAYPTEIDDVDVAPTVGTLGGTTPTHTVLHDKYRTALLSVKDKINSMDAFAGVSYTVLGLVEDDDTASAANTDLIQDALELARIYGEVHAPMHPYLAGDNEGGATVQIPPGFYYIDRSVLVGKTTKCLWVGNASRLRGAGMGSTRLRIKSGVATTATPCGGIGIYDNTNWVAIEDLTIDGACGAGETVTDENSASHGIDLVRSGNSDFYDGGFHIANVMIFGWQGTGLKANGGTTTLRGWHIYSYHNKAHGFVLQTDQALWGCKAGNNVGIGYAIENGTNVQLFGCKAFGGDRGISIGYSESITVAGCQVEDYTGIAGIYVTAVRGCQVQCEVYRCQSTETYNTPLWVEDAGTAQADPYHTDRPFSNTFDVVFHNITPDNITFFDPKYHLVTRHLGAATQIRFTGKPGTWVDGRHNTLGQSHNGQISFNGSALQTFYDQPAFETPYTPGADYAEIQKLATLTANLTVNAPSYPHRGQKLTFIIPQGASAYTVTFNATFKLNGNAFNMPSGNGEKATISFVYDGTDWVETYRSIANATGYTGPPQKINAQTGTTYTPTLADIDALVTQSNASPITTTLPQDSDLAVPIGERIDFAQIGAGQVTFTNGTGATVNGYPGLKIAGQWGMVSAYKRAANTWLLVGALSA